MSIFQYIIIYFAVGAFAGFCIELLMDKTEMNEDTSIGERILWIILWPYFVLVFIWGMYRDDE